MNTALERGSSDSLAQRFKERILHTYFVRCDMSLILLVVVASGVGSSKLLLESGVHSLLIRYPLALLVSFAFGAIRQLFEPVLAAVSSWADGWLTTVAAAVG